MNTINDLKTLLLKLFYSISFKYRIHIPFLISIITIVYIYIIGQNKDIDYRERIYRQTFGYDLLGLTYFVIIFSILNLIFLKGKEIKWKIFYTIENLMFFLLFFITIIMYGFREEKVNIPYNLTDGIYPFFKISIVFFIILYFINRKKINSN